MATMSIEKNSQENIQNDSDAYYETNASQEEIYLEEVEEELRAIVTSDDPSPHNSTAELLAEETRATELGWRTEIHDCRQ